MKTSTLIQTVLLGKLTNDERDAMKRSLVHLAYPDAESTTPEEVETYIASAMGIVLNALPPRICQTVLEWRSSGRRPGVVVIDNLPTDPDLPPTPIDGKRSPDKLTGISELILTGIAGLLGQPFSFAAERDGQLIQDLAPVKGKQQALTNEGAARLGFHTEHAATGALLNPSTQLISHLVFFGLRSDHEARAKTLVSDIRDALTLLGDEDIQILREPQFRLRLPYLVRESLPSGYSEPGPMSLVTGPTDAPQIQAGLYGDLTEATTIRAETALDHLAQAVERARRGVTTQPGRLVIVDNHTVLHARAPFTPRFDGGDRWLQRILVTSDLWPLRQWQVEAPRTLTIN